MTRYTQIRSLRRDGNCFYRALVWQMFEYFLTDKSEKAKKQYQDILAKVTKSKQDLMDLGFDAIVIDDFYDAFLDNYKNLETDYIDPTNEKEVHEYLERILSNNETTPYILIHLRYMTSCYLKTNAILYQDFMVEYPDVNTYCQIEVEGVDHEADQMAIIGITNYLDIAVEINRVQENGMIEINTFPEDAKDDDSKFKAKLLFTPGHYDALYL